MTEIYAFEGKNYLLDRETGAWAPIKIGETMSDSATAKKSAKKAIPVEEPDNDVDDKKVKEVVPSTEPAIKVSGPATGLTLEGFPFWPGPEGWYFFRMDGPRFKLGSWETPQDEKK